MTRINGSIEPSSLCDQHLLAEHREIVRLRHLVDSKSEPPSTFRLGTGHVLWFKYKLGFAKKRYNQLYIECIKRGFNVSNFTNNWDNIPTKFLGDWEPTEEDNRIIQERIDERLSKMKRITYTKKN